MCRPGAPRDRARRRRIDDPIHPCDVGVDGASCAECGRPMRMRRALPWVITYAAAMAYVEAAVVVYLRAIYYPDGFAFPLAPMPPGMAAIEIGREAATLVMLLGVAMLAGSERRDR